MQPAYFPLALFKPSGPNNMLDERNTCPSVVMLWLQASTVLQVFRRPLSLFFPDFFPPFFLFLGPASPL
jgi:hypothetical protein